MTTERARLALLRCLPAGDKLVLERVDETGLTGQAAAGSLHASLLLAGDGFEVYEVVSGFSGPAQHREGVAFVLDTSQSFRIDLPDGLRAFYSAVGTAIRPLDLAALLVRFTRDGPPHRVYTSPNALDVLDETRPLRGTPGFDLPAVDHSPPAATNIRFCSYTVELDPLSGALLVRAYRWDVQAGPASLDWTCEELPIANAP